MNDKDKRWNDIMVRGNKCTISMAARCLEWTNEECRLYTKLLGSYKTSTHGGHVLGWECKNPIDRRFKNVKHYVVGVRRDVAESSNGETMSFNSSVDRKYLRQMKSGNDVDDSSETVSFDEAVDNEYMTKMGLRNGNGSGNVCNVLGLGKDDESESLDVLESKMDLQNKFF